MPRFKVYLGGLPEPIEFDADEEPHFEGLPDWTEVGDLRIRKSAVVAVQRITEVRNVGFSGQSNPPI